MNSDEPYLSCKDFLVSGEEFKLYKHPDFDILSTRPVPENLKSYYKSQDYISHTDSRENFTDKLYGIVKNYMLNQKISWIEKIIPKGKILDIGAGTGDFLKKAQKNSWEIEGIEPDADARKLAKGKGLSLNKNSGEFDSKSFDAITMWHVLEHVPDLPQQIEDLKRLLKDDGLLIIAVPNFKSHDAKYYKEFWAAYDVPRHLWHFSQKGISELFNQEGFLLYETKALKFDSFYVSLLSEKYKTGHANFGKAFYRGIISNFRAKYTNEYSSLVYFFKKS